MNSFTPDRRSLLKAGGGLLTVAATMSAEQLLGYAKAWAQASPWKPEAGAKINLLRWKRFVESEDVAFMKIVDAFQKATGVTVNVSNESYDDLQPKASVRTPPSMTPAEKPAEETAVKIPSAWFNLPKGAKILTMRARAVADASAAPTP